MINTYKNYNNKIKYYSKKYGYYSIPTLLLKYSLLITLLKIKHSKNVIYSSELIDKAYKKLYNHSITNSPNPPIEIHKKAISIKSNENYEYILYDKKIFEKNHELAIEKYSLTVDNSNIAKISECMVYTYCLNQNNKLIISIKPFTISELVKGRNGFRVTHGHLVYKTGLKVLTAGELIFIKSNENTVSNVIINNRSGHFQPSTNSLYNAKKTIADLLNISTDNIYIIPFKRGSNV